MREWVTVPLCCAIGKSTEDSREPTGNATVLRGNQLLASLHTATYYTRWTIHHSTIKIVQANHVCSYTYVPATSTVAGDNQLLVPLYIATT